MNKLNSNKINSSSIKNLDSSCSYSDDSTTTKTTQSIPLNIPINQSNQISNSTLNLPFNFNNHQHHQLQLQHHQINNLTSTERSSIFRHHRNPSNASETSSSPFPEQSFFDSSPHQPSTSPAPSFEEKISNSFVDEPLPMEGEFATMDLHSPANLIDSFLPHQSSSNHHQSQPFRYNTLTWAKEHPYPEPQDSILSTGGLDPKSSFSQLVAMLESGQQSSDFSKPSFQNNHIPNSTSSNFQQINHSDNLDHSSNQDSLDQSNRSIPQSESSNSHTSSINPLSIISNHPQIPTITTSSLSPNSTSSLLRLNMDYPAMPTGPSISLTSATPSTAKPGEQIQKFFETMDSIHSNSMSDLNNNPQSLGISQSNNLFQPLITHPTESNMQTSQQISDTQSNSFLNSRPVRARQRSKSESMGKQHWNMTGTDAITKYFFGNPAIYPSTSNTEFTQSDHWVPSSSPATTSYFNPPQNSTLWNPFQTNQYSIPTSQTPQLSSQSSSNNNEGQTQLMQNFIGSSYLSGGLFEQVEPKKELHSLNYDSSFLKPTAPMTQRRSHSVTRIHRRGRSEGQVNTARVENEPTLDSLLSTSNLTSSNTTNTWLANSQDQSNNSMNSIEQLQHNPIPNDTNRTAPFPTDVILEPNYNNTLQQFTTSHSHSPVPSEACLSSLYSSRPRSFSHCSSFGSEDTGGSGPPQNPSSSSLLPLDLKSRTTAATKAAAVKRRKAGVAARYVCDMCGETFTRRYNLRGHQRAHKGEKPFACGYPGCTSRFARAHDQKRHYKLHLGVKDYSCPVCKKTFIRLDALQRHHKSDAGQACFQQLDQTSTKTSTTKTTTNTSTTLLTKEEFIIDDQNDQETSLHYSDSIQGFILPSSSKNDDGGGGGDDGNDDESKPFLLVQSGFGLANLPPPLPLPVPGNSNPLDLSRSTPASINLTRRESNQDSFYHI